MSELPELVINDWLGKSVDESHMGAMRRCAKSHETLPPR
jgi:hypothetical protein